MPDVSLIFPPLVERNFGHYFPSTAILAGYLATQEISVNQIDLNEQFAEFLLDPEYLRDAAGGSLIGHPSLDGDHISVTAARWLLKNPGALYSTDGRHEFSAEGGPAFLLKALATPYLIDPDSSWLARDLDSGWRELDIYDTFFSRADLASQVSEEVRVIGISVPMGPQLVPALLLATRLRQLRPQARIVLGGPTLSLMDVQDLSVLLEHHRQVDAVVRFDGEYPLAALTRQALMEAWDPGSVPNVSSLAPDGSVTHHDPAPGPPVNTLPWPVYQKDLMSRLAAPVWGITQARGCYWGKCDYCDFVEMYDGSPPYRGRSVDSFLKEVEHAVVDYGITRFEIITESIPPAFARKLSEGLISRGLDIRWDSFAMVDRRFDADLFRLMRQGGCEYLVIGMETMNTRVLKLVHKSADREENIRFLKEAKDAGIRLRINLIPDLPSTTYEEAMQALDDVRALQDCAEGFAVYPFEATRSSNIGRNPENFGLRVTEEARPAEHSYQAQYDINHLRNVDPAMSDEEREQVKKAYTDLCTTYSEHANPPDLPFITMRPEPEAAIRLATHWIDIHDSGSRLAIVNVLTRERMTVPEFFAPFVRKLASLEHFTLRDLYSEFGDVPGHRLASELIRCRLLEEVPEQPVR